MPRYVPSRPALFVLIVGLVVVFVSGCYEPTLFLEFDEHGNTPLMIVVTGGDMVSEDQMACMFSQLTMLLPELTQNYDCAIRGKEIRFVRRMKVSAADFPYITLTKQGDGSYVFEAKIPALYAAQESSESVFLRLQVTLPVEIERANTVDVDDKTAVWTIRKNQLHKEQKLEAITVAK